jgi:glutamine synthetase
MTYLNAAVASTFRTATGILKDLLKTKPNRDEAVMEMIKGFLKESKKVRFDGNGYSQEWRDEAAKRGLPILKTTADALESYKDPKLTAFLSEMKVLSAEEVQSRYHISVERYVKTIDIEIDTLLEMTQTIVIPAVENQLMALTSTHQAITSSSLKKYHASRTQKLEATFESILSLQDELVRLAESTSKIHDESARMKKLAAEVQPLSFRLREACDQAERLVSDEMWPLPKYREMLFAASLV